MTKSDPLGLEPLVEQVEKKRDFLAGVEKDAEALQSCQTDAAQVALTVEEQKKAKDEEKKREIITVEQEYSPEILKVARTIDDIVNNQVFTTEIEIECPGKTRVEEYEPEIRNYKAQVTVKDGLLELTISHKKRDNTLRWDNTLDDEEATISINTKKDKIQLTYVVRESTYSGKGKGLYRISRFFRKAPKAFRFLAEDSVDTDKQGYISDFIDIYKTIPEILAKAIAKMKEEQEAKKKQLEIEKARLSGEGTAIVEQIKAYEPGTSMPAGEERTSQAEEPKLLKKKIKGVDYSREYRSIRDIGEEIGLYSTSKRRKR